MTALDSTEYVQDDHIRLAPTAHWITTAQVSELLFMSPETNVVSLPDLKAVLRHKPRASTGEYGPSTGYLWFKPDVLALAHIRRETRSGVAQAARTLLAYRENRLDPKP